MNKKAEVLTEEENEQKRQAAQRGAYVELKDPYETYRDEANKNNVAFTEIYVKKVVAVDGVRLE